MQTKRERFLWTAPEKLFSCSAGTPARVLSSSIDYSKFEKEKFDYAVSSAANAINFITMLTIYNSDDVALFAYLAATSGILGISTLVKFFKCNDKLQELKDSSFFDELHDAERNIKKW